MYISLVEDLVLEFPTYTVDVTPLFLLDNFDTVQMEFVVKRYNGPTNLTLTLQQSCDGDNWDDVPSAVETTSAEGYKLGTKRTGLAAAQYRIKMALSGSTGLATFSVGVNLSQTS